MIKLYKRDTGFFMVFVGLMIPVEILLMIDGIMNNNYISLLIGAVILISICFYDIHLGNRKNKKAFDKTCNELISYQKRLDGKYVSSIYGYDFISSPDTKQNAFKAAKEYLK